MSEPKQVVSNQKTFSIRRMMGLVAAFGVGMIPMAYFGWKGVVSTVFVSIAGVLFVFGSRKLAVAIVVLLLLGQFFYPALDGAREAILRTECQNNMRQLVFAIHDYEGQFGKLPPPYSTDQDGNKLHSWRVLLLPFLGEQELFDQIDKTKPWDDPVNLPFHDQMPDVYCCGAVKYHSRWRTTGNTTSYVVVVGPDTAWNPVEPVSFARITDGFTGTVAIVESENHRLHWMAPKDPGISQFVLGLDFSSPHGGVMNFAFLDSSVALIGEDLNMVELEGMLMINDGK